MLFKNKYVLEKQNVGDKKTAKVYKKLNNEFEVKTFQVLCV